MTIQEQIEEALLRDNIGSVGLIYTLLLRIRELEKQVDQERWRKVEDEKPEKIGKYLIDEYGDTYIANFDLRGKWVSHDEYGARQGHMPTHWKPINLPSVLTK